MANYTLPVFNQKCNIWRNGNPTTNPPDLQVDCNLALGRRTGTLLIDVGTNTPGPGGMWLLVPKGTDIRDSTAASGFDRVEVPIGTGRFYFVCWVDDVGSGFSNEHRFAEIVKVPPWPVPFPSGGTPPPGGVFDYLNDTGAVYGFPGPPLNFTTGPSRVILAVMTADPSGTLPVVTTTMQGLVTQYTSQIVTGPVPNFLTLSVYEWMHPGGTDDVTVTCGGGGAFRAILYSTSYQFREVTDSTQGTVSFPTITASSSSSAPTCVMLGFCVGVDALPGALWPSPMIDAAGPPETMMDPNLFDYTLQVGVYYFYGIGTPGLTLSMNFLTFEAWAIAVVTYHP